MFKNKESHVCLEGNISLHMITDNNTFFLAVNQDWILLPSNKNNKYLCPSMQLILKDAVM